MESDAKFSLLLPVYAGDDAAFLRLAFESSTRAQTLPPAEVVLVQDGPVPDALAAEIHRIENENGNESENENENENEAGQGYENEADGQPKGRVPVTIIRLPENRGLTAALNAGIDACKHPVIARMDADDVSEPTRFERQWRLMNEGFDLVGTGMSEFEVDPAHPVAPRIPPTGSERIRAHARTHNPFNHPTMMYRRAALDRVGRYQPFGKMEDYWLGVRLIADGAKVENIAEPLVKYRVGAGAFARRGGWQEAKTEWKLQGAMRRIGFISTGEYLRNVVVKGAYRLMPASLKRVLYRRFVGSGLPGDRSAA